MAGFLTAPAYSIVRPHGDWTNPQARRAFAFARVAYEANLGSQPALQQPTSSYLQIEMYDVPLCQFPYFETT